MNMVLKCLYLEESFMMAENFNQIPSKKDCCISQTYNNYIE